MTNSYLISSKRDDGGFSIGFINVIDHEIYFVLFVAHSCPIAPLGLLFEMNAFQLACSNGQRGTKSLRIKHN